MSRQRAAPDLFDDEIESGNGVLRAGLDPPRLVRAPPSGCRSAPSAFLRALQASSPPLRCGNPRLATPPPRRSSPPPPSPVPRGSGAARPAPRTAVPLGRPRAGPHRCPTSESHRRPSAPADLPRSRSPAAGPVSASRLCPVPSRRAAVRPGPLRLLPPAPAPLLRHPGLYPGATPACWDRNRPPRSAHGKRPTAMPKPARPRRRCSTPWARGPRSAA